MARMTPSESAIHRQTFTSTGTYSIESNEIKLETEIPAITLSDANKTYELKIKNCYDISNENIACMLVIYSHGHPSDRRKLQSESLITHKQVLTFNNIFKNSTLPSDKIFVITVHDEDFKEEYKTIYHFFAEYHVTFDDISESFERNLRPLKEFINGKFQELNSNEEPRTVGGGVIDPA